jgi:hypothetical protein
MPQPAQLYLQVVALLEEISTTHFESSQPLLLQRGQIGTVVEVFDDGACEVEFADPQGRTYALLTLAPEKLMVLRDTPVSAAA